MSWWHASKVWSMPWSTESELDDFIEHVGGLADDGLLVKDLIKNG